MVECNCVLLSAGTYCRPRPPPAVQYVSSTDVTRERFTLNRKGRRLPEWHQMPTETKFGPCSVASEAAEVWVLDNRHSKKLELVQVSFLRPILCLTRLDKDVWASTRYKSARRTWIHQPVSNGWHVWQDGRSSSVLAVEYRPIWRCDMGRPKQIWKY